MICLCPPCGEIDSSCQSITCLSHPTPPRHPTAWTEPSCVSYRGRGSGARLSTCAQPFHQALDRLSIRKVPDGTDWNRHRRHWESASSAQSLRSRRLVQDAAKHDGLPLFRSTAPLRRSGAGLAAPVHLTLSIVILPACNLLVHTAGCGCA